MGLYERMTKLKEDIDLLQEINTNGYKFILFNTYVLLPDKMTSESYDFNFFSKGEDNLTLISNLVTQFPELKPVMFELIKLNKKGYDIIKEIIKQKEKEYEVLNNM